MARIARGSRLVAARSQPNSQNYDGNNRKLTLETAWCLHVWLEKQNREDDMRVLFRTVGIFCGMISTIPCNAEILMDISQLQQSVNEFLASNGGGIARVDARARLTLCATPVVYGWIGRFRHTLNVSCRLPVPWTVSLPVQSTNSVISLSDTASREILVRPGDNVILQSGGPGFDVQMPAIALSRGGLGDMVTVRQLSGRSIQKAIVVASGIVSPQP